MKNQMKYWTIVLLFFSLNANSQDTTANRDFVHNKMFWFSGQINGKISGKWYYGLDIEYRRQADPQHGYKIGDKVGNSNWNIFKNPFQDALRPWIHYQPNDNIRFSLSPITWFGTFSFPVKGKTTFQPEYRITPQVTFYTTYGRVQFQHRFRYELRFYGLKKSDPNPGDPTGPSSSYSFLDSNYQNRVRYQFKATIPLNSDKVEKGTHYIATSEEVFVKWGKGVSNSQLLDQNRLYLGYGYKFHEDMRVEIGYLNQIALKMNNGYGPGYPHPKTTGNNIDFNNILYVSIVIEDLNDLFKKNKTEEGTTEEIKIKEKIKVKEVE